MKQNIIFIITAIILFSSVFVSATLDVKTEQMVQLEQGEKEEGDEYILKEDQGHIAVYRERSNESEPMLITETLVNTLPCDDQKRLKDGICVKGDTALRKALEDYCS